jgi:transposase
LPVLRPDAAGIDIGAEDLWVAVPADRDPKPVQCFSSFTTGLQLLAEWLEKCGIRTVAMESTGVLWITVFQMLVDRGFEVCLVNARHYQNVPGKRTDVQDCQWLQFLHSVGLLRASFRPEQAVCAVRTLVRHREQFVQMRAQHIQHMQKALDQMNLKLHYVISDLMGVSGQRIIRAILKGQRDPQQLAELCDCRIKARKEQIQEALTGDYRPEHLFTLQQSFDMYQLYSGKLETVDKQVERYTAKLETKLDLTGTPEAKSTPRNGSAERRHLVQMQQRCHEKFGVDVCAIPGMKRGRIAETLLAEVGPVLDAFSSASAFAAWQGLAPNHQITGGKIVSRRTKKIKHPVALAFRMAAQALEHERSYMGQFYRMMKGRLGAPQAITATAHKLARIFFSMVKNQTEYEETRFAQAEARNEARTLRRLNQQAARLGLKLVAV